jgi:hypothetical protein
VPGGTITPVRPAPLLNAIPVADSLTATVDSAISGTAGMIKTEGNRLAPGNANTLTGRTTGSAGPLE